MSLTLAIITLLFSLASACALAQAPPSDALRLVAESFLIEQAKAHPGQATVELGRVPDNPRMVQCQQWEAFLPQGARAWGRISLGVRCVAGTQLSLFIPAVVRIEGRYVTVARPLSGGQQINAADLQWTEGELTAQQPDVVTSMEAAVGKTARQALSPQQVLRAMHVRLPDAVQAGQTVKVISKGPSFTVTNEGRALANAGPGQLVRVRLMNNQVVSGIAREQGVVEVTTK